MPSRPEVAIHHRSYFAASVWSKLPSWELSKKVFVPREINVPPPEDTLCPGERP